MWISKLSRIISSSPTSFEKRSKVEDGGIAEYRVQLRLHFDMAPNTEPHW